MNKFGGGISHSKFLNHYNVQIWYTNHVTLTCISFYSKYTFSVKDFEVYYYMYHVLRLRYMSITYERLPLNVIKYYIMVWPEGLYMFPDDEFLVRWFHFEDYVFVMNKTNILLMWVDIISSCTHFFHNVCNIFMILRCDELCQLFVRILLYYYISGWQSVLKSRLETRHFIPGCRQTHAIHIPGSHAS